MRVRVLRASLILGRQEAHGVPVIRPLDRPSESGRCPRVVPLARWIPGATQRDAPVAGRPLSAGRERGTSRDTAPAWAATGVVGEAASVQRAPLANDGRKRNRGPRSRRRRGRRATPTRWGLGRTPTTRSTLQDLDDDRAAREGVQDAPVSICACRGGVSLLGGRAVSRGRSTPLPAGSVASSARDG
jgi:hypothetical protein